MVHTLTKVADVVERMGYMRNTCSIVHSPAAASVLERLLYLDFARALLQAQHMATTIFYNGFVEGTYQTMVAD